MEIGGRCMQVDIFLIIFQVRKAKEKKILLGKFFLSIFGKIFMDGNCC